MRPGGTEKYLDELEASTTPLDQMLGVLKQDAIDRFQAGDQLLAKSKFRESVVDAIKIARQDRLLLVSAFDGHLRSLRLGGLAEFEADLDRAINYVLSQVRP